MSEWSAPGRTYMVLVEASVDTDHGDLGFVYLGTWDARTPALAARAARRDGRTDGTVELVVIPASAWQVIP